MPPETDVGSDESTLEPGLRPVSREPQAESVNPEASRNETAPADAAPKADRNRNNRRRRGKGKPSQKESDPSLAQADAVSEESTPLAPEAPNPRPPQKEQPMARAKTQESRPQPQKNRRKLDPEKVAANAWSIFLAEVSEEGVALIADNDARELARRCFRLSEIFLEEQDKCG